MSGQNSQTLQALATMKGVEIKTKDIVSKWLLLTYDLPHTEEGDKARRDFLQRARLAGATCHTESVYLMPWSLEAELIAINLSSIKGGEVWIWTSDVVDQEKARFLTERYDNDLKPQLEEVDSRIDRIWEHANEGHLKQAKRMMEKTEELLHAVTEAIIRRGSAILYLEAQLLARRWADLVAKL